MADIETPRPSGFSMPLAIKFFLGSALLIALAVAAAVVTMTDGTMIREVLHSFLEHRLTGGHRIGDSAYPGANGDTPQRPRGD